MSNMFINYETASQSGPHKSLCIEDLAPETGTAKMLFNIKGDLVGVQVDHFAPLQLYFHLEGTCEVDFDAISTGVTLFEILTTTHKVLISREYFTSDILDSASNDLYIFLSQPEMRPLGKETYNMRVTLKTTETNLVVFDEGDGYLVIR